MPKGTSFRQDLGLTQKITLQLQRTNVEWNEAKESLPGSAEDVCRRIVDHDSGHILGRVGGIVEVGEELVLLQVFQVRHFQHWGRRQPFWTCFWTFTFLKFCLKVWRVVGVDCGIGKDHESKGTIGIGHVCKSGSLWILTCLWRLNHDHPGSYLTFKDWTNFPSAKKVSFLSDPSPEYWAKL